ncbi:MAG: hypothetical protein LAO56_01335 [Acidobacteriia bacterium]|nr:hypothetical protein [Terriglobia bacterium]
MTDVVSTLEHIARPPSEKASFDAWLEMADALAFLKGNVQDDEFVVYATMQHTYIHAVLVPVSAVDPPNIEDLLSWNCGADSGWGVVFASLPQPSVSISPPLNGTGSSTLDKGEQLVFARRFEGRLGEEHYHEILQKFLHISEIHFLPERSAYCRFNKHGDIEDVIRVIEISAKGGLFGGTVITFRRDVLDRYLALTDSAIARTFDFTRFQLSHFGGWRNSHEVQLTKEGDLFYRTHVEPGHASYMRGCQIVSSSMSKESIARDFWRPSSEKREYESFIAHDWKNNVVKEISCAPGKTANYFTESGLPFELSPAFFRPEVLSKYKADSEKYRLEENSISCRGAWHLQNYDINEAGQVHTYLVYLRNLPYEEQLYWKSYNETPKGTISKRAYLRDFEGSWEPLYDPLESLKDSVRTLHTEKVPWWTLRSAESIDRVHYPATFSPDEWATELLQLDQMIVEGFESKWLRSKASMLGRNPDPKFASLTLVEECFIALGFAEDEAKRIVTSLRRTHDLRTKLKGHASGKESVAKIKQEALAEYGTYRAHFRVLCGECDKSIRAIATEFKKLT